VVLGWGAPSSAKIVYNLKSAPSSILNQGGEAPVNLSKPNYRTLLLGLKQSSDYTFHVEATRDGKTCASNDYALPTTGSFATSPPVTVPVFFRLNVTWKLGLLAVRLFTSATLEN